MFHQCLESCEIAQVAQRNFGERIFRLVRMVAKGERGERLEGVHPTAKRMQVIKFYFSSFNLLFEQFLFLSEMGLGKVRFGDRSGC